jgi:hypothetical protein
LAAGRSAMKKNVESRLRRKLLQDRYPRRAAAILQAADSPDHNPTVVEDCKTCGGSGQTQDGAILINCITCDGIGTALEFGPLFTNDNPLMYGIVDEIGRLRCLHCRKRFPTYDPTQWTGLRHVSCGQRIEATYPEGFQNISRADLRVDLGTKYVRVRHSPTGISATTYELAGKSVEVWTHDLALQVMRTVWERAADAAAKTQGIF